MKIALDYYNTISQYPGFFREFAQVLLDGGAEVHIISAIGGKRLSEVYGVGKYQEEIKSFGVPYTHLNIILFEKEEQIPWLKYDTCKKIGIDMMIDDRPETIAYFQERDIIAIQMPKPIKI